MGSIDLDVRDALLLAFAELGCYGVATVTGAAGEEAGVRADLARTLREQAPHGLGSYAFWLSADEFLFAGGGMPSLYTSGDEVDRALAARSPTRVSPRDRLLAG